MNDTFNINRFWLLVRRQWTENKKVYLLLWGVISISVMVLQFFSAFNEPYILYILLFCFSGCALSTTLFSRWSDYSRSSFYLLLPASVTEKFLCGLFYGIFLFIPVYCVNYFIFRYIITYLVILLFPNNLIPFSAIIYGVIHEIITTPFSTIIIIFLSFLFTQSLFMTIFIRFKRNQVLIFLITIMAILLIYNYGMGIFVTNLVNVQVGSIRVPGVFLTFYSPDFGYQSFKSVSSEHFSFIKLIWILNNLVWFLVFFILYLTARFKLKEREI